MDTDNETGTPDQMAWDELAQAVRAQLRKYAENIPAMKADEVKAFVETCKEALWFEEAAKTFDREVELRNSRVAYMD